MGCVKRFGKKKNIKEACISLNLDFVELCKKAKLKINIYHSLAEKAANINVFGSPTYILNDEIFWGQDRLDLLEEYILENL